MRATRARIFLGSALPKEWVSISQKGVQKVQMIFNTIIDGSRFWLSNTLNWASMEGQWLFVLWARSLRGQLVAVMHNQHLVSIYRQNSKWHGHCPILKKSVNRVSRFLPLHLALLKSWFVAIIHIWSIDSIVPQNCAWYLHYPIMKMSVNGTSTIFSRLSQVIKQWSSSGNT